MSGTNLRLYGGGRFPNPFELIDVMQQEMNRVFRDFGSGTGQQQERGRGHIPLAEVIEEQDAYRVALEVPGIDPQQVEVNLTGHTLTVQAERREHHQTQQGQDQGQQQGQQQRRSVLLSELSYGQYRRTFEFAAEIDTNRAEAEFRNGLLSITLPKSAQARDQQRRIEIKTS